MSYFVGAILLVSFAVSAQPKGFSIEDRPLRDLLVGSELYIPVESDLADERVFQNGRSTFPGESAFDEGTPSCRVESPAYLPPLDQRNLPLTLVSTSGSVYDSLENTFGGFRSTLVFQRNGFYLEVICSTKTSATFTETSIGQFEKAFGMHVRFGKLNLDDAGVEIRSPLYGEDDVLAPEMLRKSIEIQVKQDVILKARKDGAMAEAIVANGQPQEKIDYEKPYCELVYLFQDADVKADLTVPAGTVLRATDVSGDYDRAAQIDMGFSTLADLTGFEKPLRLNCSSANPAKPLRYLDVRQMTLPILDWVYSF